MTSNLEASAPPRAEASLYFGPKSRLAPRGSRLRSSRNSVRVAKVPATLGASFGSRPEGSDHPRFVGRPSRRRLPATPAQPPRPPRPRSRSTLEAPPDSPSVLCLRLFERDSICAIDPPSHPPDANRPSRRDSRPRSRRDPNSAPSVVTTSRRPSGADPSRTHLADSKTPTPHQIATHRDFRPPVDPLTPPMREPPIAHPQSIVLRK